MSRHALRVCASAVPVGTILRVRAGPKLAVETGRNLAVDRRDNVRVPAHHGRAGPAQDAHDRPLMHAEQQEHGGGCVPRVVEPSVTHPGLDEEALPCVPVRAGVDRSPGLRGENPTLVEPQLCGILALVRLVVGVRSQQLKDAAGSGTTRRPARDFVVSVVGRSSTRSGQWPAYLWPQPGWQPCMYRGRVRLRRIVRACR